MRSYVTKACVQIAFVITARNANIIYEKEYNTNTHVTLLECIYAVANSIQNNDYDNIMTNFGSNRE